MTALALYCGGSVVVYFLSSLSHAFQAEEDQFNVDHSES
jgi:hypothetical protein